MTTHVSLRGMVREWFDFEGIKVNENYLQQGYKLFYDSL